MNAASAVQLWPATGDGIVWFHASIADVDLLLRTRHYLGKAPAHSLKLILAGSADGQVVAAQVWKLPTAKYLPNDGTWLELARWCLTPEAGLNAGSRMHAYAVREIKALQPAVTTLISYSDSGVGHTGSLYRACNWQWFPTWHRLKPPPTGGGTWDGVHYQTPKDRWIFSLRRDDRRAAILAVKS